MTYLQTGALGLMAVLVLAANVWLIAYLGSRNSPRRRLILVALAVATSAISVIAVVIFVATLQDASSWTLRDPRQPDRSEFVLVIGGVASLVYEIVMARKKRRERLSN